MFAGRLLDVCSMFALLCKRGIAPSSRLATAFLSVLTDWHRLLVPRCRLSTFGHQSGFSGCWFDGLELTARWT